MNTIKVQIEIPSKWLELDTSKLHNLCELDKILREDLKDLIKKQAIEKIMKNIKIPKIDISKEVLTKEVLSLITKIAIEQLNI